MHRKNILIKIKQFLENTEAISPIVATILVLAVAVAAGVAFYYWFGTFQTGAQAQVENSSTSSMNIMVEKSLGSDVLKVSLPVAVFEYKETNLDVDNDGLIYRPESSGNYSAYSSKYKNNWRDERRIQEITIYIENKGPNELTGVNIKYTQLASTLDKLLRLDRDNNYQLLDINGEPVHVEFNQTGVQTNNSYSYYFSDPGYAMILPALDYSDPTNNKAYLTINQSSFYDDRTTSTRFFDVDGNSRYAIAEIDGAKTGWNTGASFFTGKAEKKYGVVYWGLNDTIYDWCKENLHGPVYDVGTLKPGESKKIYTYYYLTYMKPEYCTTGDSFADCTIDLPIQVSTDQGASQTVTATMHLVDKDTT